MKDKSPVLLIAVMAILILGMAGAALLMVRPAAGSSGSAAGRPGVDFTVAISRITNGIAATLTVANTGSEDLQDLRITRADIASQNGATPMPLVIGTLPRGAVKRLVLPYTGIPPAANAPVQLMLVYDYKYGVFGNGSGSRDVTARAP